MPFILFIESACKRDLKDSITSFVTSKKLKGFHLDLKNEKEELNHEKNNLISDRLVSNSGI